MLPYQTLQQAEEGLGRASTVAEKLWFKYSANKPDYILHYHNTLFLFLFYSILPLPFIFLELFFSREVDKYKIQPKFKRSFSDMFQCYIQVVRTFLLAVVPLQLLSYPTIKVFLPFPWPQLTSFSNFVGLVYRLLVSKTKTTINQVFDVFHNLCLISSWNYVVYVCICYLYIIYTKRQKLLLYEFATNKLNVFKWTAN